MEDTQDKVRRNIVTLSALIIATHFFDPTMDETVSLFGVVHFNKVSPIGLWLCVIVVLIYMFLRYRFDDKTIGQLKSMEEEYREFYLTRLRKRLSRELADYVIAGRKPKLIIDPQSYADENFIKDCRERGTATKSVSVSAQEIPEKKTTREGRVSFTVNLVWKDGNTFGRSGGNNCNYRVPAITRFRLGITAFIRMVAYSKSGVDVFIPIALAGTAMMLCVGKLIALNGGALRAALYAIKALCC